jgi:hypothetical protein
MGYAKLRRDALRRRQPLPEDFHVCPTCRSRDTRVAMMPAKLAMSHAPTLTGVCVPCGTFWEAYPPGWTHDVVGAEPCDNCAFRPGSPESQDKAEWKSLLAKLKAGGMFNCHKGAPILLGEDGSISFDERWVQLFGRTCAGFHRAIMTRGDWLENRLGGLVHVLTKHDQDALLGEDA